MTIDNQQVAELIQQGETLCEAFLASSRREVLDVMLEGLADLEPAKADALMDAVCRSCAEVLSDEAGAPQLAPIVEGALQRYVAIRRPLTSQAQDPLYQAAVDINALALVGKSDAQIRAALERGKKASMEDAPDAGIPHDVAWLQAELFEAKIRARLEEIQARGGAKIGMA